MLSAVPTSPPALIVWVCFLESGDKMRHSFRSPVVKSLTTDASSCRGKQERTVGEREREGWREDGGEEGKCFSTLLTARLHRIP